MIRFSIQNRINKYGTNVTLRYKSGTGERVRAHTRAIINVYRRGLEKSLVSAFQKTQRDAGYDRGGKLILFMPFDALDGYDGKGELIATVRGVDYVMIASTEVPLGEDAVYTWAICSPAAEAVDDYGDLGGGDDVQA